MAYVGPMIYNKKGHDMFFNSHLAIEDHKPLETGLAVSRNKLKKKNQGRRQLQDSYYSK